MTKRICVLTGNRAEYGLLKWIMFEINRSPDFELKVIVTGAHLSQEYGNSYSDVAKDFEIDERVEIDLESDTNSAVSRTIGQAVIGITEALERISPDAVIILGDRYEVLAAAVSAAYLHIPIIHISGGELTTGSIDDRARHAITKLADFHLVSHEEYRRRVIQMGETPSSVITVGDPAFDNFQRIDFLDVDTLEKDIGLKLTDGFLLVTYHPSTAPGRSSELECSELLKALNEFTEMKVIITNPNSDAGNKKISQMLQDYVEQHQEKSVFVNSLGQQRYLSLLKIAHAVVGNSSSGIIEAPALETPTVNIGDRQLGRLMAQSVINCEPLAAEIVLAIKKAISLNFEENGAINTPPYTGVDVANKVLIALRNMHLEPQSKIFFDVTSPAKR